MGVGYRGGTDACFGRTSLGCGKNVCHSGGKDSTLHQFSKIVRTYSIAANCESHMLVGTSFSAADNKCMVWVIIYSSVTWGCVRYACKYLAVSIIINDLVCYQFPGCSGSDGVPVLH